jgi:ankyrin repeat protein
VIKALLKAGVDVNETEPKTKQNALMWAVAEGHEDAVRVLLAAGADIHAKSARKETPLFFAVRRGDIGIVDALLGAGADVNERADFSPGGRYGGGGGSDVRTAKVPGDSMLVLSILNAHFQLAAFLVDKGADVNMTGARWTALHAISRIRDFEQAQYPAPEVKLKDLDTLELAKILIAHGANPNARGMTPVARREGGDQNYVEILGATPFFLAAKSADVPYMRLLMAAGADPTIATEEHTTPLMVAAGVGCVTGQWLEPEADVLAAVKLLVEETHPDINAVDTRNGAAIHGAVCRNADSVIQYLVDKGARLDIKDGYGQTPLDLVEQGFVRPITINGFPEISLHALDHTAALVKKLTAEQNAAKLKQTAQN